MNQTKKENMIIIMNKCKKPSDHQIGTASVEHDGISHASGEYYCFKCNKTVEEIVQEAKDSTLQEVLSMIPEIKPFPLPIEKYLEKVKNGNKDDMFQYGFDEGKQSIIASITSMMNKEEI